MAKNLSEPPSTMITPPDSEKSKGTFFVLLHFFKDALTPEIEITCTSSCVKLNESLNQEPIRNKTLLDNSSSSSHRLAGSDAGAKRATEAPKSGPIKRIKLNKVANSSGKPFDLAGTGAKIMNTSNANVSDIEKHYNTVSCFMSMQV